MTWKRLRTAAPALAAVLVCSACSTLQTSFDYDRSVDFSKYRTFAFKDVQPATNELVARRIANALETVLTSKGLIRDDANPDLWVVAHARIHNETQIIAWDTAWGYGWHWHGPGFATATAEQIPVGTLVVDLVDSRANELVWRSRASDVLDPSDTPAEKDEHLHDAVSEMFDSFPPHG
jgi:hypothetical protein